MKIDQPANFVDILELPGMRKICKPTIALEKHIGASSGVKEVVTDIAKLLEQFYDVQVVV